jgi:hypothetical protein
MSVQTVADKLAISLSMVCAVHCLALPILLVAVPSLVASQLNNEAFHLWMVAAVVPSSIYALTLGCKQHKYYRLIALGGVGLVLLVLAVALGEELIGEFGEKALTLVGASFVAIGHFLNYRLCSSQKKDNESCLCPSEEG